MFELVETLNCLAEIDRSMSLIYDEHKNFTLKITTDTEDILNAVKILVEKNKVFEKHEDGFQIKLQGNLCFNLKNKELTFSF